MVTVVILLLYYNTVLMSASCVAVHVYIVVSFYRSEVLVHVNVDQGCTLEQIFSSEGGTLTGEPD